MADPVLYATQEDLESALSPSTVIALFEDTNNGHVDRKAIVAVLNRASRMVDSHLARVYRGPFPVSQVPVPEIIKAVTIEYAMAFSFERHPEYVHTYGEEYRSKSKFERAESMAERLVTGQLEIPDWTLQPKGGNIGGIILSDGPRTIIDGIDGSSNGGDF